MGEGGYAASRLHGLGPTEASPWKTRTEVASSETGEALLVGSKLYVGTIFLR